MSDFPALDVAIGLIFLYIVLALVGATVNEMISTVVGLRARFLQLGLLNLFSAAPHNTEAGLTAVRQFYGHPLIQTMIRPRRGPDPSLDPTQVTKWFRRSPYPSYIPSRTFVTALVDMAERGREDWTGQATDEEVARAESRVRGLDEGLERAIAGIPNSDLSNALLSVYRSATARGESVHHSLEQWFDDSMERVSGWYKRRTQLILFAIAAVLVCLLNADSLSTGRVLWRDDATRAAIVQQAEAAAAEGSAEQIDVEAAVRGLDLPLGWTLSFGEEPTQLPDDWLGWVAKLLGLLMTVTAVMLGAPFWFDLLSKVMRVRSTGSPPPASDAVRTGDADQRRAGPGATPRAAP